MDISKLCHRSCFALVLFFVVSLMIMYTKPVSDFYGIIVNKKLNFNDDAFDRSELMEADEKQYLYSCPNWNNSSKENIEYILSSNKDPYMETWNQSTCSYAATRRGPHQRIVSFSFYGSIKSKRNYFQGIEDNVKLMEKFYPDWIMRLYHDIPPPMQNTFISNDILNSTERFPNSTTIRPPGVFDKKLLDKAQAKLCYLQCKYPYLDLCYVENIPGFGNLLGSQGNMWRFLPMADPLVDVFVSRDVDSRLNARERAAVDEWLASNLTFHIMRDHPYHNAVILGGMWGAVIHREREALAKITRKLMEKGKKYIKKSLDQTLLGKILWPITKGTSKQHDSYHCERFGNHNNMAPWPTRRPKEPYNFVGSRIGTDTHPLSKQCPKKCRPKDKQDWIYC